MDSHRAVSDVAMVGDPPYRGSWPGRAQTVPDGPVRYKRIPDHGIRPPRPVFADADQMAGGSLEFRNPQLNKLQLYKLESTRDVASRDVTDGVIRVDYKIATTAPPGRSPAAARSTGRERSSPAPATTRSSVAEPRISPVSTTDECSSRCLAFVGASGGRRGRPRSARGGRSISVIARHVGRDRRGVHAARNGSGWSRSAACR